MTSLNTVTGSVSEITIGESGCSTWSIVIAMLCGDSLEGPGAGTGEQLPRQKHPLVTVYCHLSFSF